MARLLRSIVVLMALASTAARAAEPTTGRWQGTSWGFELHGGVAFRTADDGFQPIPNVGLGFRVCTLLTLIDAELYVATEGLLRENRDAIFDMRRTSIAIEGRLHPLFVRHLQGGFGDRIAAGFNVSLGLGADLLSIAGGEGATARDDTYARFALGVGFGFDIPLTDPDDHPWSIWLGLGAQLRFVGFPDSAAGLSDMDEKVFALRLGVRFHDISGVRFPVPPELNDTDR